MSEINAGLLNELRIGGEQRDDDGGGTPRWLWPAGVALLVRPQVKIIEGRAFKRGLRIVSIRG